LIQSGGHAYRFTGGVKALISPFGHGRRGSDGSI
jgi:hypothetical protein